MAKRKRKNKPEDKGIKESAIKQVVRTPMFKMRVERDKTKYTRKGKGKSFDYNFKHIMNSIFKVVIKEENKMIRTLIQSCGGRPQRSLTI